jgi:ketosteroid isomerase-like protein
VSENLEIVRSILADWERGDYSSTEWVNPEIEFVMADGPDPGNWTGIAALADWWRRHMSVWEDTRVEVDECRELDEGQVLVLVRYSGRAKRSGLEFGQIQTQTKGAWLFQVRDGRVTRLVRYWDRDRALADLGLEE